MYKTMIAVGNEALNVLMSYINAEGGDIEHMTQNGEQYTLVLHYGRWIRESDEEGNRFLRCSECGMETLPGAAELLDRCQWCLSPMEEIEPGEENKG